MTNKTKRKTRMKQKKATPFADAGAITGRALGNMFNMPYLKGVGKWLGSGIGQIFGSGDYQMVGQQPGYNVLMSDRQIPKFSSSDRTNIVCHREYIGDINGSIPFVNRSYPINPGMSQTFPWLSTVAKNYQEYRVHGMIFEFRPLITDFITSGAPGVVVLATNYNSDKPPYRSRIEMENSEYAVSVKPTNNLIHGIECAINETPISRLYVRSGAVPDGQDLRLYDLGLTQFASQGNPAQLLGELWVSYCIEFFKPVMPEDIGSDAYTLSATRAVFSPTLPLGGVQQSVDSDIPGLEVGGTSIIWSGNTPGTYLVTIIWSADTPVAVSLPNFSLVGGANLRTYMFNNTSANFGTEAGTVTRRMFYNIYVVVPAVDITTVLPSIVFANDGVFPTGNTSVSVVVTEVDTKY